jgi:hypothetical protein
VARATGLEPAASCVTGRRSNLSEAARANVRENWRAKGLLCEETADTRSIACRKSVTGQRSNQLNYVPTRQINEMRNRQCLCGVARIAY